MRNYKWRIVAAAMLVGGLAACGNNNTPSSITQPPPMPAAKLEDQFGAGFGVAYRADPNTDPKDPMASDIIPLSLTTDPVAI